MTELNEVTHPSCVEIFGPTESDRYLTGMNDLDEMMRNDFPLMSRQTWLHVLDAINGCETIAAKELPHAVYESHLGDLEERDKSVLELNQLTEFELFVVSNFATRAWDEYPNHNSLEAALSRFTGRPENELYAKPFGEQPFRWQFNILKLHDLGPIELYEVSAKHPSGLEDVGKVSNLNIGDRCMISGFEEILDYPDPARTKSQIEAATQLHSEIEQWFADLRA